ncbi:hypothetical protein [Mesonia aquimarina]|uniref:hypothetical protein n=1 Tax=Mesonia aquimarina TaxID=1504967 RepID=UPI000EF58741|nr:hypothetical protein [Mesonia aquimarina]
MKKIFLYTLIAATGLLSSCNHNNPNDGKFNDVPDSGFLNFATTSSATPDNQNVTIPLSLTSSVNSEGLDVTYIIEAEDGDAPDAITGTYTQENAIPAGKLDGNLEINIADVANNPCYQVKITLLDTNNSNIEIGLANQDEDGTNYPTEHFISVGQLEPSLNYTGVTFFQGSPAYQFTPTLTPIEGEVNSFEINTAWGMGFLPSLNPDLDDLPYDGTLTINNDGSVTIEGNQAYATGGEGFFNACDGTISYTLTQAYLSDTSVTFDVILSPAN